MWVNSGICCLMALVRKVMVNLAECQHDENEYSVGGVEAEWRNHRPVASGSWLVASDRGMSTFGDARIYGSTGGRALTAPIVGIAGLPTGNSTTAIGEHGAWHRFGPVGS
jgi:hypothetical protein